jgi:hypothetical protein
MIVTKELKEYTKNMSKIPDYYIGKNYKYEARKVISDWELSWNIGNAVTYLLRANFKHSSPEKCIEKAINHLKFELDELKINKGE